MFNHQTQVTPKAVTVNTFNIDKVMFSEPIEETAGRDIRYKRIRLGYAGDDGSINNLIFIFDPQTTFYSFGIQENKDQATDALIGYNLPICLWNRGGATEEQEKFTNIFNQIVDYIKQYLVDNRNEIEEYDLEMSDLKKFNPLYWKKEKGEIIKGRGPTLYAKLIYSKKDGGRILTKFVNPKGQAVDPFTFLGKHCLVQPAIKFESIYIGAKISLQIKLHQTIIEPSNTGFKDLLTGIIHQRRLTDEDSEIAEE